MRVLITGATGLVGSEIVRICHKRGILVNYLTTSRKKLISRTNYQGFYWNPDANEIDVNCFEGVTAIINLAGASISIRWTTSYKKQILSSRVKALQTLHKALSEIDSSAITSFVSASAIGVYPNSETDFYSEEETKIDNSFLGEVVAAWEKEIDAFSVFSFTVSKIRVGLVLAAKGGALPEMAKPIKYGAGAIFGSGLQWQSWIHVTDLARLFLFVIKKNQSGIYNGVGPNPVTNDKLTKEIARVLGRPLILPNIPQSLMKIVLGEMSYLLFSGQRVSSKKVEKAGFEFKYANICCALENIFLEENSGLVQDTVIS